MVSEVKGTTRQNANPFELLALTFPQGTLSGAPKFKAMELIDSYEPTVPGYYAGCIGSIGFKIDNLRNQLILFALIGAPMLLILIQKDTGTALVFSVFVLVFFREGMSSFIILIGLACAAIFVRSCAVV